MTGHHGNGWTTSALIVTAAMLEFALGYCYLCGGDHESLYRIYFALGAITLLGLSCLLEPRP